MQAETGRDSEWLASAPGEGNPQSAARGPEAVDADIAATVLAATTERRRRRRRSLHRGPRRRLPYYGVVMLLGVVCVVLTSVNLASIRRSVPTRGDGRLQRPSLEQSLTFEVSEIEAFRRRAGRIPVDLAELGHRPEESGWTYEHSPDQEYRLSLQQRDEVVSFDSRLSSSAPADVAAGGGR